MRFLPSLGLVGFAAAQTSSHLDLFDYGQRGPILGSSFGTPRNATYDYVIVGGGTAGLTIASRLSLSQSNLSVAVVEAGGFYEVDNGNVSVVPGYGSQFSGLDPRDTNPLVDWGVNTVPQRGAGNRVMHYARGKTLGGSSARNYMFYHRPTIGSMQKWADEVDDQSFVWDKMFPYFKKSTHYTPPDPALFANASSIPVIQAPDAFEPAGGPLQVSFSNYAASFAGWVQRALVSVGLPQIEGFNSGKLLGSGFGTSTINPKNAHRSSSESSFLQTALNSGSGLIVYKNTLGQKILFDSDNVAIGVQVSTAGTFGTQPTSFTLSAREEVILSTGAFQSPQLLMVSGVGPCDEISEFDIPCISDLPGVGKNLQDHVLFGPTHRVHLETASVFSNNATATALIVQQYLQNATGRLSIAVPSYYGWEKLPEPYRSQLSNESIEVLADYPDDWPEIEWLPLDSWTGNHSFRGADPADGHNYATITVALVAPQSRGSVTLNSSDMNTLPVVDPAFLEDQTDVELAIASFKRSREIWGKLVNLGIAEPEYYPGMNVTTDEQILEFIRENLSTVYHVSGTCKMGREDDSMAVVDSKARVYGVHRLRIVDTSAFPFLIPGHPQATVYALAEKIAYEILNEE